jgi:hypothetical protein
MFITVCPAAVKLIGGKQKPLYPVKSKPQRFQARKNLFLGKHPESHSLFLSIK